jgi:dihydrofolate reductase
MKFNLIVAICKNGGIGKDNALPWHFSKDLKFFAKMTKGNGNNAVIMGNNTHKSIINVIGKSLPNRTNLILSKHADILNTNVDISNNINVPVYFKNINDVLQHCLKHKYNDIWVIGGHSIYSYFLECEQNKNMLDKIYITEIDKDYECDTFLPKIPDYFELKIVNLEYENNTSLYFKTYIKKN